MSIKNLISETVPKAIGAGLGSAKEKIDELASKASSSIQGGFGQFSKLIADGKDKLTSASNTAFRTDAISKMDGLLTPEQISDKIRQMSPPGEGTVLDNQLNELQLLQTVEGEITAEQIKKIINANNSAEDQSHKVKLIEKGVDQVIFNNMPEVVENRSIEYEAIAPPQSPAAFQKYKGTASTQWTVQATLTSRNTDEATENLRKLNVLRGWTMPFFGNNTKLTYPDKLGAPPPVLEFSGWRNQMVGPVQVVITSLNWNFPQDVDYIPARGFTRNTDSVGGLESSGELIPFPTVIKLQITLVESFSTDQMNSFDLAEFRTGRFDRAFKQTMTAGQMSNSGDSLTATSAAAVAPEEAQTITPDDGLLLGETSVPVSEAVEQNVSPDADFGPPVAVQDVGVEAPAAPLAVPPDLDETQQQRESKIKEIQVLSVWNKSIQQRIDNTYYAIVRAENAGEGEKQWVKDLRSSIIEAQAQVDATNKQIEQLEQDLG